MKILYDTKTKSLFVEEQTLVSESDQSRKYYLDANMNIYDECDVKTLDEIKEEAEYIYLPESLYLMDDCNVEDDKITFTITIDADEVKSGGFKILNLSNVFTKH